MDPIISSFQEPPDFDFYKKKQNLNEDFFKNAKIPGLSVGLIYYPSQREFPLLGHSELQVEESSWTILGKYPHPKSFPKMVDFSQNGEGSPFYRLCISVTLHQLNEIKKELKNLEETGIGEFGTCSMGTLRILSNQANYKVPFPITLSPFISSIYLTSAKFLGSKRIEKIEFYGKQSQIKNFTKAIRGLVLEPGYAVGALYLGFRTAIYIEHYLSSLLNQESEQ